MSTGSFSPSRRVNAPAVAAERTGRPSSRSASATRSSDGICTQAEITSASAPARSRRPGRRHDALAGDAADLAVVARPPGPATSTTSNPSAARYSTTCSRERSQVGHDQPDPPRVEGAQCLTSAPALDATSGSRPRWRTAPGPRPRSGRALRAPAPSARPGTRRASRRRRHRRARGCTARAARSSRAAPPPRRCASASGWSGRRTWRRDGGRAARGISVSTVTLELGTTSPMRWWLTMRPPVRCGRCVRRPGPRRGRAGARGVPR